jgi:hypothetical protein
MTNEENSVAKEIRELLHPTDYTHAMNLLEMFAYVEGMYFMRLLHLTKVKYAFISLMESALTVGLWSHSLTQRTRTLSNATI